MKKILFLDIDGVIATNNHWDLEDGFSLSTGKKVPYLWDMNCCKILSNILESTDSDVVISSDWRLNFTLDEIKELFKVHKINPDRVIGTTEKTKPKRMSEWTQVEILREREILNWVQKNSPNHWVAIDDLYLAGLPRENYVMVRDSSKGLDKELVSVILESKLKKNEQIII